MQGGKGMRRGTKRSKKSPVDFLPRMPGDSPGAKAMLTDNNAADKDLDKQIVELTDEQ